MDVEVLIRVICCIIGSPSKVKQGSICVVIVLLKQLKSKRALILGDVVPLVDEAELVNCLCLVEHYALVRDLVHVVVYQVKIILIQTFIRIRAVLLYGKVQVHQEIVQSQIVVKVTVSSKEAALIESKVTAVSNKYLIGEYLNEDYQEIACKNTKD